MAIVRSLTVGLVTFSGGCARDILVGLMDGADNSINNGLAWKSSIFAIYVNKGKDCINEKSYPTHQVVLNFCYINLVQRKLKANTK